MNDKETIIVISQRDLRIPLQCPKCKTWTKNPITKVKTTCHKCKIELELDPSLDNIDNIEECLRDAVYLAVKLFMVQKEVKIHYSDKQKTKTETYLDMFRQAFGLEASQPKSKTIILEKKGMPVIKINEITLSKPEHMLYYLEK